MTADHMQFRTHTGEIVSGERLRLALEKVANDWRELSRAIRHENAYAPHVTEAEKAGDLRASLARADAIAAGEVESFTIWQRVNAVLTGECVPYLP